MKSCIYLITLLSSISLIYSDCTPPKVKVGVDGENNDICGTEITGCTKYASSSTASKSVCETCDASRTISTEADACYTTIEDCTTYEEEGQCATCGNSKKLLKDKSACVDPIQNCDEQITVSKCGKCTGNNVLSKDESKCVAPITNCEEYTNDGKCSACTGGKIPAATTADSCVDCDAGKETTDGKVCYTKIADCKEYESEGKCAACNGKVPKSDKSACEACPDGKETKDGKTCVDKTDNSSGSSSSFIYLSSSFLLCLFYLF